MVNSMTGYGSAHGLLHGREISVEMKSVNHRYFEFSARIPRTFGYLEEKLKSLLSAAVGRGKIDVGVTVLTLEGTACEVRINRALADGYLSALRELGAGTGLRDNVTLTDLARFGDIFTVRKAEADEQQVWADVAVVARQALDMLLQMKRAEGEKLEADVLARLDTIEAYVKDVEQRSPQVVEQYRQRLYARLREVLDGVQADDGRVLTEAAIFAEKTAVAEETVRLGSHIALMRKFLQGGGESVGKKLDFLVQEMNRETNTIGSKAQDIEIQQLVVEMKSEIEKIREQIQNIE